MTIRQTAVLVLPILLGLVFAPHVLAAPRAERDAAVEPEWYDSLDGTYRVRVPQLLTGPVETADDCPRPGITCTVMFSEDTGWHAGITATRIRPGYPMDDSLLERVETGQTEHWGPLVQDSRIETYSLGNGLTYRLRIEEAGAGMLESRKEDGSLVRRAPDLYAVAVFVVANGYLYEFDYAIPQPGPEEIFPPAKIFGIAEDNVREFMDGFQPNDPTSP